MVTIFFALGSVDGCERVIHFDVHDITARVKNLSFPVILGHFFMDIARKSVDTISRSEETFRNDSLRLICVDEKRLRPIHDERDVNVFVHENEL